MKWFFYIILTLSVILATPSCQTDSLLEDADLSEPSNLSKTRAIPTPEFDWENADWMPTPPGQTRIPSPWVGAGGISGTYGMDITNDRYKTAGWELVYNTFDSSAPGSLVNPYFVLYNKYTGILRIYIYLTTQFIATSSYLQDGITIISNSSTSLLNYLGKEVIDPADNNSTSYSQIQLPPNDGSSPLAANKWYMVQYELAYDPNLETIAYNQIQLVWYLNYHNIQTIKLNGTQIGRINGTIGSSDTKSTNSPLSKFKDVGKASGTALLAGIGSKIISDNTINESTGKNKLGLPEAIFSSISKGLKSALSSSIADLPKSLFSGLSAIFGSKNNTPIPISLQLETTIELDGTISEKGAFPSTPISFWMPGTAISADAVGYIPLYNKSLGVIHLNKQPVINTTEIYHAYWGNDPYDNSEQFYCSDYITFPKTLDYSQCITINPEVEKIADVTILKQDLIYLSPEQYYDKDQRKTINYTKPIVNPTQIYLGDGGHIDYGTQFPGGDRDPILAIRFTIEIKPKNGDNTSVIYKTFKLKENRKQE